MPQEWYRYTNPERNLYVETTCLLSVLSKIFERLVRQQLFYFMDENKLFYSRIFGFRSKLSPIHALADFTELNKKFLSSKIIVFR